MSDTYVTAVFLSAGDELVLYNKQERTLVDVILIEQCSVAGVKLHSNLAFHELVQIRGIFPWVVTKGKTRFLATIRKGFELHHKAYLLKQHPKLATSLGLEG